MPEIRLRPKHQVTLPASIVRQAHIQEDDRLLVSFINGSIIITPKKDATGKDDVMSYAGIYQGAWGDSLEDVERTMRQQRSEWQG